MKWPLFLTNNSSLCLVYCPSYCLRAARENFLSTLLNGFWGLSHHGFLTISDEMHADLQWWLNFLSKYNGISIISSPIYRPDILILMHARLELVVIFKISVSMLLFHHTSWQMILTISMLKNCLQSLWH